MAPSSRHFFNIYALIYYSSLIYLNMINHIKKYKMICLYDFQYIITTIMNIPTHNIDTNTNDKKDVDFKKLIISTGEDHAMTFGLIVSELYQTYGTDAFEVVEKAMIKKGQLQADMLKKAGVEFNNFSDFGKFCATSNWGIVNSIISPTRIEMNGKNDVTLVHTGCAKFEAWNKLGLDDKCLVRICELYFRSTEALLQSFFDDIIISKESLIPKGDSTCRIRFRIMPDKD